jgi:hypothetical protein
MQIMVRSESKYPLYKYIYEKNDDDMWIGITSMYDDIEQDKEYWSLDHNTMKYFETIEEIPKPKDWEDLKRIHNGYQYHSQLREYNRQCYELVRTKLGEELDELFFILSRTNDKNNASQRRNINDALSQSIRYK